MWTPNYKRVPPVRPPTFNNETNLTDEDNIVHEELKKSPYHRNFGTAFRE